MLWPTPSCSCAHRCCCNSPTCACPKTCHLRISPQPVCMNIVVYVCRARYSQSSIPPLVLWLYHQEYHLSSYVWILLCVCALCRARYSQSSILPLVLWLCHQEYYLSPYVWILLCSYAGPGIHRVLPPLVLWLYHHNPNHKQLVSSIHFPGRQTAQKKIEFTQHKKYTAVLFQTVQFEMITNSLRDFV